LKYLKTYKLFEKVQSFNWTFLGDAEGYQEGANQQYSFSDNENEYLVEFTKKSPAYDEVELKWFVVEDGITNMNRVVNSNPFRILETILGEILIDYLNRNEWVGLLYMQGLGKDIEKELETQRTRFYVRYLKNNPVPGYELYHGGNDIELVKIEE
jgi:hypothetical protein